MLAATSVVYAITIMAIWVNSEVTQNQNKNIKKFFLIFTEFYTNVQISADLYQRKILNCIVMGLFCGIISEGAKTFFFIDSLINRLTVKVKLFISTKNFISLSCLHTKRVTLMNLSNVFKLIKEILINLKFTFTYTTCMWLVESASADKKVVEKLSIDFLKTITDKNFLLKQMPNKDKTSLFWEKNVD